jgi:hypothetical protein
MINSTREEHAIVVHYKYNKKTLDPLQKLETQLSQIIEENSLGEYDGHEIAKDTNGFIYMYGSNAEHLFKAVKPVLDQTDFMKGAVALLRFGGPGASDIEVEVGTD